MFTKLKQVQVAQILNVSQFSESERVCVSVVMNSLSASALSVNYDNKEDFREAFNAFDWNHSGKISYSSLQVSLLPNFCIIILLVAA